MYCTFILIPVVVVAAVMLMARLLLYQSVVLGSTTTALGVTTAVPEASAMEKISIKLNNLHLEYSPQKKIELLLKACKIIYDSMSISCPGQNALQSFNIWSLLPF